MAYLINKRISVTPVSMIADGLDAEEMVVIGRYLNQAAAEVGVLLRDFQLWCIRVLPGRSGSYPAILNLSSTEQVCSSINVATTSTASIWML